MANRIDSITGCIAGGAIGDACGLPFEGSAVIADAGLTGQKISDDTQLTLATCEAITINNGMAEPQGIAAQLVVWYRSRRFTGMGASTHKALSELAMGGHWALVGRKGEYAAGNGAAMRIAPLAFCLDPYDENARQIIRDVSRITHHSEEAYAGALAVVLAVRAAWKGGWTGGRNLPAMIAPQLPDSTVRDRLDEMAQLDMGASISEVADKFGCSGYVAESVPLALYGAGYVGSLGFEKMICELIGVGGDTDTTASIAGQIAGTLIGKNGLPEHLWMQLHERDFIERVTREFAEKVDGTIG